jgi:hypothetical protein
MQRAPDSFHELFARHLAEPVAAVGFRPWGKSLLLEDGLMRVAVLRTERRSNWPFEYTLAVSHLCLRDRTDRLPPPPSREPTDWPVTAPPSQAVALAERFRYESPHGATWPHDRMDERHLERQLTTIADALIAAVPRFAKALAPRVVLDQLKRRHTDAWIELRWIEDYEAYLQT